MSIGRLRKRLVHTKQPKSQSVVSKLRRNALQESPIKLWQSGPNHVPLKVVQVGRKHRVGLESKLLHREFLNQKRALRQYSLLMMSLRKRENWSQQLSYVIGISVIKILQFHWGQKPQRNL